MSGTVKKNANPSPTGVPGRGLTNAHRLGTNSHQGRGNAWSPNASDTGTAQPKIPTAGPSSPPGNSG